MPPTLNIAFFGSSLVSAYWNGAATYYRGIVRALAGLGHHVTFFEPDAFERQHHRDLPDPDWARIAVYAADEAAASRALEEASHMDLVIKCSGVGVLDEFLEAAVADLRRPGRTTLFWDVDAPATLDRVHGNPEDPFRRLIPRYDLILTYGGGPPVVEAYRALGARGCIPIYNALDPITYFPAEKNARFEARLGFLGNRLPDRESRVEDFFLSAAKRMPGSRFLLGGSGWDGKAMPTNVSYAGHIYTHEHNAFNSSPVAVLNVNRESMVRYGFSPPTRIFEAAGAGACIISDEWTGMENFLQPGREVLVAKNGEEVAVHLEGLTAESAQLIGSLGRRRILSEHTYAHRARQLESVLGLSCRAAAP